MTYELEKWSGRLDSNQRPPAPKAGALPGCATPRHLKISDSTAVFCSRPSAIFAFQAKTVAELSQNPNHCRKTPSSSSRLSQNSRRLVGRPIELQQRFALHLQLHLRVLLEHFRISLPEELRHPLVRHAAGAQARRVGRAQVVDAEVPDLRPPQRQSPGMCAASALSNVVFPVPVPPEMRMLRSP